MRSNGTDTVARSSSSEKSVIKPAGFATWLTAFPISAIA